MDPKPTPAGVRLTLLLVALVAAVAKFRPIKDTDAPWHLRDAIDVYRAGSFRLPEISSFTVPGKEYIDPCWLGDFALYAAQQLGGWPGLVVLTGICAAISTILIGWIALRSSGDRPWLAVLVTTLTAASISWRFEVRPECFRLVFFPAAMLLADAFAEEPDSKRRLRLAALLAALQLFWSHVHASFSVVPVIAAIPLAGRLSRREWREAISRAWLPALLLVVMLFSPFGLHYFQFVSSVARGDATSHIAEMRPMRLEWLVPTHWDSILWLDLLLMLAVLRSVWERRARIDDLLRSAFGLLLTMTHHRLRADWGVLSSPWSARVESDGAAARWDRPIALAAVALVFPLTIFGASENNRERGFGFEVDREAYPADAADAIEALGLSGDVFNNLEDGGWLSLRLKGRVRIALDGRVPTTFDDDLYFLLRRAMSEPSAWRVIEERFKPNLALIYRKAPLCAQLAHRPEWQALYVDSKRTLFARTTSSSPHLSAIDPCAPIEAATRACNSGADLGPLRAEAESMIALTPEAPFALLLAARLEVGCAGGRPERAGQLLARALDAGSHTPELYGLATEHLSRLNSVPEALAMSDRAVEQGGGPTAMIARAKLRVRANDPKGALADLEAAVTELEDLTPPDTRLELARLLAQSGRIREARQQATRAAWTGAPEKAAALLKELGD